MIKNKYAVLLFLNKEGKELMGKHNSNLWILSGIFLLAILSIGFASASLKYLKYKMDDPFIQWVDIKADQREAKVEDLESFLENKENQKRFNFEDPQANYLRSSYFRNIENNKDIQLEGRSIKANSAVLTKILSKENVIKGRDIPYSDNELGLIITQDALKKIGYDRPTNFVYMSMPQDEDICSDIGLGKGKEGYYEIAFPIVAVVKQLPGMHSYLFTDRFCNNVCTNSAWAFDITEDENNEKLLICGKEKELDKIIAKLNKNEVTFSKEPYLSVWEENFSCLQIMKNGNDDESIALYYNQLYQSIKNNNIYRVYPFEEVSNYEKGLPGFYSIQMFSLDSIRSFQTTLFAKTKYKMDMESVDAKDNFRVIQRLGNILSICIILISVIFICAFIYFLLNTHFQKIQKNLGTFKAFGLSNKTLYPIYMLLLLGMTLLAYIIAFVISFVFSHIFSLFSKIEPSYAWIDVVVGYNGIMIIIALLSAVLVCKFVTNKKLKHTPGDLIYDRVDKE